MRVGFDETDAQAVVYYGRYLPYFDRARVEYQRHLGLLHGLPGRLEFVMRRSSQEYEAPARFDDLLEVFVRIARIGRTSTTLEFRVRETEDGTLLAIADQVMVLIDADSRTARRGAASLARVGRAASRARCDARPADERRGATRRDRADHRPRARGRRDPARGRRRALRADPRRAQRSRRVRRERRARARPDRGRSDRGRAGA